MLQKLHSALFTCVLAMFVVSTAVAQEFRPGDIFTSVLGEDEGRSLQKIDPLTGDRITVSGAGVGSGLPFEFPIDLAYSSDGIFVSDRDMAAIFHVDPATGDRQILSGASVGTGPAFVPGPEDVFSLALETDGSLLAAIPELQSIFRIDLSNGNREIVSSPTVGNGPLFGLLTDLQFTRDGRLLGVDQTQRALFQVDPATGDRAVFSGLGKGTGTPFSNPTRIDVGINNEIVVADWGGSLVRINPASGDRETITSAPFLDTLVDIAVVSGNQLVTSHPFNKQMYETNLLTGESQIFSATADFGLTLERGDGPDLNFGLMLEPISEVDSNTYNTIEIVTQLDGQASCSNIVGCRVEDGDLGIRMQRSEFIDNRGVIEFDLSEIAPEARVQSASITLDITGSGSNSRNEISEVSLHGYVADGVLTNEDAERSGTVIGRSLTNSGQQSILLDAAFVQDLIESEDDLGILLLPGDNSIGTTFSAQDFLEMIPEFPGVFSPTLVLELFAEGLTGDFDDSGTIDQQDIDALCSFVRGGELDGDLNADSSVDLGDLELLLGNGAILVGDTDTNGVVEFADFLRLSANFGDSGGWASGDSNCDGQVGFADFLALSGNFGRTASASNVPEPATPPILFLLLLLGWKQLGWQQSTRSRRF